MSQTTSTPDSLTPQMRAELGARVAKVVNDLPVDYLSWCLAYNPDWATSPGRQLIKDVKVQRRYDEDVTAALEHTASYYQEGLASMRQIGALRREEAGA